MRGEIHSRFALSQRSARVRARAYLTFQRQRQKQGGPLDNKVEASLSDENTYGYQGVLSFIDNAVNRSSGTIHARATFKNPDLFLAPGQFARVRLGLTAPALVLLVPDASVLADQSSYIVLTVSDQNVVVPKAVQLATCVAACGSFARALHRPTRSSSMAFRRRADPHV